jgi:hypothetical protein
MVVEPNNAPDRAISVSSLSAKAIGHPPARVRAGDAALLHRSLLRDVLGVAMTARMRVGVENAKRWGAVGIFRLANLILNCAMSLHKQRRISHSGLRTVLSGTRRLERFGAWLALGRRRRKRQKVE